MAITKTVFSSLTVAEQASEVLAWLQANATSYFDTIEYNSESSQIVCSVNGVVALALGFASGVKSIQIYAKNGATASTSSNNIKFGYGVVTSTGIYLSTADNARESHIFITKNNSGELFMVAKLTPSTSGNTTHLYITDFNNSTESDIRYIFSQSYANFDSSVCYPAALTTLIPITGLDCTTYAPNLYLETFNEYNGISGKFEIGNTEYFSNGYLALKG